MSKRKNVIAPQNIHNSTIERRNRNRTAFVEVLGDPGEEKRNIEPVDGWYQTFKTRGTIAAMRNNFDQSATSRNPAAPSVLDFFCDVESSIKAALTDEELLNKFWKTFVTGESTSEWLDPQLKDRLQQKIGRLFVKRRISPVHRYFISIRNT
jgi:hypothetical protein